MDEKAGQWARALPSGHPSLLSMRASLAGDLYNDEDNARVYGDVGCDFFWKAEFLRWMWGYKYLGKFREASCVGESDFLQGCMLVYAGTVNYGFTLLLRVSGCMERQLMHCG